MKKRIVTEVKRLRLKYPGEQQKRFDQLSLTIEQGEKVLLLGPSGCGKSTLLQVLAGIIPHSLEVPIKADKIQNPDSWGYVFQDPDTQFCMPYVDEELAFVLENLQVPREKMVERIHAVLQRVGLTLPDIHTPIQALSQGMKQRLAIASTLILEPEVLFLDEPTALLDPQGTKMIWQILKEVGRSKTLVIVEHKIDEIYTFVDRVLLFDPSGKIIVDGHPQHIFETNQSFFQQYGIWYPHVWDEYLSTKRKKEEQPSDQVVKPVGQQRWNSSEPPVIELDHFSGLRAKRVTIHIQSARVRKGEWIGIVGPNGAGKSTLLLALRQLIHTQGTYRLLGKAIGKNDPALQQLAFVFQNPEFQFVTHSVRDEIMYTLVQSCRDKIDLERKCAHCLSFFQLEAVEKQHPYQLSIGQKRRLSVATAIAGDRQFILLDEPTFGQDAQNTFAMLEQLEELQSKGTTILMVTHDEQIMKHYCTQLWEIDGGACVFQGTPDEYLHRKNYARTQRLS